MLRGSQTGNGSLAARDDRDLMLLPACAGQGRHVFDIFSRISPVAVIDVRLFCFTFRAVGLLYFP
jgi:hypothetical protein